MGVEAIFHVLLMSKTGKNKMKLIAALLIFYPSIMPLWQKGPISNKSLTLKRELIFIDTPTLKFQIKNFPHVKDLRIKSRILFEWTTSNNPYAVSMFTNLLKEEPENAIKADILINLFAMKHIKKSGDCALYEKWLSDSNDIIRAYSGALYLDNGGLPGNILKLLEKEKSQFVINLLFSQLKTTPNRCSTSQLEELLSSDNQGIHPGAVALLAVKNENPDLLTSLHKVCKKTDIETAATLAKALASRQNGGEKLLAKLADNDSSIVRAYVASAQPRKELLTIYLKLAEDSSWEVRRTAAVSLGKIKNSSSIKSLIKLLSDPISEVRDAAETALIEIAPSKEVLQRIGQKEMPSLRPRPYAITILGAMKDLRFAPQITNYLKSVSDENIIYRSITALDQMDYKKAEKAVLAKYNHANPRIQQAVAHALGTFAMKESFSTIVKLSTIKMDKNANIISGFSAVAIEAITSMARIADPYFNTTLTNTLCNVKIPPDLRATACWSVAKINQPTRKIIRQIENITLNKIIPTLGGVTYDSESARISALLAMVDMSKKHTDLKGKTLSALKTLTGKKKERPISSLEEYARQVALYMNGEKNIKPSPLPTHSKPLTLSKQTKR